MLVSQLAAVVLTTGLSCPGPMTGTAEDDHLRGTRGDDVIYGYRGDDRLWGRRGPDVLAGGRGDDVLRTWIGGQGRPVDPGPDVLRGGPGADRLYVSLGDRVRAGPGDDHVWAYYLDEETDFIDCGPGEDVLHLHQNLSDLSTLGCEEREVQIAG